MQPASRQKSFNRASQFRWREFASHRQRIAAHLLKAPGGSLCVLGAGNCNDLDLPALLEHYTAILLVDVDVEAMRAGVQQQLRQVPQAIEFAACDLTGALEHLHDLARMPSQESFARLRGALLRLPAVEQIQRQFQTVASTCVLSQLIDSVRHVVGPDSPQLAPLAELVRMQHLRTIAELTAPGGEMLLFADFVSSDTLPDLLTDGNLPALMQRALRENNCFAGMNPQAIRQLLNEPPLSEQWEQPAATESELWRWNLGPRTYLVTAIAARRQSRL